MTSIVIILLHFIHNILRAKMFYANYIEWMSWFLMLKIWVDRLHAISRTSIYVVTKQYPQAPCTGSVITMKVSMYNYLLASCPWQLQFEWHCDLLQFLTKGSLDKVAHETTMVAIWWLVEWICRRIVIKTIVSEKGPCTSVHVETIRPNTTSHKIANT